MKKFLGEITNILNKYTAFEYAEWRLKGNDKLKKANLLKEYGILCQFQYRLMEQGANMDISGQEYNLFLSIEETLENE